MLEDIKKTGKHSLVYAIGSTASKIIGLILIPLYTNTDYLSHSDYGALSVLEATSQLLVGILSMAMTNSLARWYWDKGYRNVQKSIFFTTVIFLLACIMPVTILLLLSADQFSLLLFSSGDYSYLLKLTIGASVVQIVNNQSLSLLRLQSRSAHYSLIQVLKLTVVLSLILYGILYRGKGLNAIWEANIIGEFVTLLLLLPFSVRNMRTKFHLEMLKDMLAYGLPLMLASVSSVILTTADRYMLSSMSGLEKTGVYSLGLRVANTLKVIVAASLINALSPLRLRKIDEPNNKRFYSKLTTYVIFIFAIALLALSLFSIELLKIFTRSDLYLDANGIIPIIGYALMFGFLKDNVNIGLIIRKKTKLIGVSILFTSILNILLNLLLIPVLDIYGSAMATLFSQIFFFGSIAYMAQKQYYIPYEWKKIWIMTGVSLCLVLVGLSISVIDIWLRLPIKIILLMGFPFILYLFNFYDEVELSNIKMILKNWSNPRKMKENINRFIK